ncbi:MAG: DNA polymerase III subunit gamma/tau [Clostridiales bacterium]|nr:DNA polymerase III subunit gamma/tau [Clostridiales bacterium]
MSYTALYRKYRPAGFDDVKGQDHIVTTLKNQLAADRIGHAYLFCGTRGTGKTTVAKIFARAVNCEHRTDGSPCGQCESCRAIGAGSSMNVIELDAASNNGVEDVRQIIEEVSYPPTTGRYKVYIIDEVHMLSINAFNALLKTLEEPPSYVIFILATTEVHKLPVTILSRCQRYDFRRISIDTIAGRLKELMEEENVSAEEKAIRYVARAADGSMRDALSLMDQCIAFYPGQELTLDKVLEVLGAVDTDVFSRLLRAVLNQNVTDSIEILEDVISGGRELGQFANDFVWYLRNLLLAKSADGLEDVLDMSGERLESLKEEAGMIDDDTLMRYIRIFSELSGQMKYAAQKRVLMEIALIRLCRPAMETKADALFDRVSDLERRVENGLVTVPAQGMRRKKEMNEKKKAPMPKAIPQDINEVVDNWGLITSKLSGAIKGYLKNVTLSLGDGNELLLVFEADDDMNYDQILKDDHMRELKNKVSDLIKKEVNIVCRLNDTGRPTDETFCNLQKFVNAKVEQESEEMFNKAVFPHGTN